MPPIQWVKLRQNSKLFGNASTLVRIVAHVVVKPDTVSKTASIKFGTYFDIQKGIAPIKDKYIHAIDTIKNPPLADRFLFFGLKTVAGIPIANNANRVIPNASGVVVSPYANDIMNGIIIKPATVSDMKPNTFNVSL